jgi:hypothetical protein
MKKYEISLKIHTRGREVVVAACDSNILGRTLKHHDIKFHISKEFYNDRKVDEKMFIKSLRIATIINLVGKKVVSIAIREGFVDENAVIEIAGIPHAQVVKLLL